VRIKRIGDHTLPIPSRGTRGSAGWDLSAVSDHAIYPGKIAKIGTGFAWEIDVGSADEVPDIGIPTLECGLVRDRSSGPGMDRVVEAGLIDGDYRGEVIVTIRNHGEDVIQIKAGERIAQMIILVAAVYPLVEVEPDQELSKTARGDNGFGHTGQ
jgi:dUTP pyrophosphatase